MWAESDIKSVPGEPRPHDFARALDESTPGTLCAVESILVNLDGERGCDLSEAAILKGFDLLRRDLARRLTGGEGAFAGYDRCEFFLGGAMSKRLCLVGRTRGTPDGTHHRVNYTAYSLFDLGPGGELVLFVANAVGVTVALHRATASLDSAQSTALQVHCVVT